MKQMEKLKAIKLNVVLLKKGLQIDEPHTFIPNYNKSNEIDFDKKNLTAILYKKLGAAKQADWVKDFNSKIGNVDLSLIMPTNQSHGVSLFIKIKSRIFALNWGIIARHNIIPSCIDKKFGIYTVNKLICDNTDTKVKSAQSRVHETNPLNKQRQYGTTVSNDQLYISMEDNEIIREIVATNNGSMDFRRLIGKYSSLNIQFLFRSTEIPCLQHLPQKLEKLYEIYKSVNRDDIRKMFKGLCPVEESFLQELFVQLEHKLVLGGQDFFLFEPEIDFDFSEAERFKFLPAHSEFESDEFFLSTYLKHRVNPQRADLENDIVCILDEEGKTIKQWPIIECLYGEIQFNGTNYILSHGEWFEIAKDKYERINNKINSIIDKEFSVSDLVKENTLNEIVKFQQNNPEKKIPKERIFNKFLSEELNGQLFDEIHKQINLYEDRFEVCDVLLPQEKKFVHVKFNSGANALSHLFNQGFVSARSYANFPEKYVIAVNHHIQDENNYIDLSYKNHCIHYLIINDKTVDRLTFFSKMVLEDKVRNLEIIGFKIKLSWIKLRDI
ncbi:TPA: hypothetical protein JBC15_15480 [Legionella pneumophila subsp. pneumophila]|uniref:DUF6119 family protein n=1 Tax=Legionella pneumophila TaxID=446 RepID=UPI000770A1BB|nr:DUF6119 family protein [Legionella pneumophila]HAT9216377.1 hypothetical protein [Legionella pneumophila subsp. pneumophila]CZI17568.1 sporadically distributed protein [Legionella pneumophila]HAT9262448.1 hypothetical protein [Legionella pneumophila subsp. pneumophila]HAT9283864.1 hypothetical protein [Legionella pneumophila subsp. pneumophila]HAT9289922.1 hypothetical protein [Legionella pneumophila subsp. pneumophila]